MFIEPIQIDTVAIIYLLHSGGKLFSGGRILITRNRLNNALPLITIFLNMYYIEVPTEQMLEINL